MGLSAKEKAYVTVYVTTTTVGLSAKEGVYVTVYVTVLKAHITFYTVNKPRLYGSIFRRKRFRFVSIIEAQRPKKKKKKNEK